MARKMCRIFCLGFLRIKRLIFGKRSNSDSISSRDFIHGRRMRLSSFYSVGCRCISGEKPRLCNPNVYVGEKMGCVGETQERGGGGGGGLLFLPLWRNYSNRGV